MQVYAADRESEQTPCKKCATKSSSNKRVLLVCICLKCKKVICVANLENESPKSVFQLIYTRFPQPPKFICYDNSCNLSVYCYRREPEWFRRTSFVIDKFHGTLVAHECMHIIFNASRMNLGGMNTVLLSMSSQQPQAGELQPRI